MKMNKEQFQTDLLKWYDTNQRILPWREQPEPYRVWISEIMLQQTRVSAVIPYFNRFIETLPTLHHLANVEEEKLLKLWEGLGYYNRARNLQKAAKEIIDRFDGIIPSDKDKLETLTGIGPYTSGAISSIAFGQKYSAVDGNVLRVFARIFEIKDDIKNLETKKMIKSKVDHLLPNQRVGDFNQALMEIGATVCIPNGTPYCEICPLKNHCKAYKNDTVSTIPKKRTKKKVPIENKTVLLLKYQDRFAIEQRDKTGLLASMYQFPMFDHHLEIVELPDYITKHIKFTKTLNKAIHKFTHKEWHMKTYLIELTNEIEQYVFVSRDEIETTYSIPSAFKMHKNYIKDGLYE